MILIHEPEIWWNMIEINKEKLSKFINLKYVHICPFFKDQSFKKVLRIHRRLAPHSPSIQVACRKWYGHPGHHTLHIWCTYIYIWHHTLLVVFFAPSTLQKDVAAWIYYLLGCQVRLSSKRYFETPWNNFFCLKTETQGNKMETTNPNVFTFLDYEHKPLR